MKAPKTLTLTYLFLVSLLIFLVPLNWLIPVYILRYFLLGFMFACLALSWDIMGGYTNYLSFGHMSFFGIGAYVTAILFTRFGISPLITVPLGAIISALIGVGALVIFLRLEEAYFAIATLALNVSLISLATVLEITGGPRGISVPLLPFPSATLYTIFLIIFVALTMVILGIRYRIENSRMGYSFLALREDPLVAECVGINTFRVKLIAFFLSSFFTGLVGSMYPLFAGFINPEISFNVVWSVLFVIMSIFGGMGVWWGPLPGAFAFHTIREMFTYYVPRPELSLVFIGISLVILILYFPSGIARIRIKRRGR